MMNTSERLIFTLPVETELVDYKLDEYYAKDKPIHINESINGYDYFDIDGNTVIFFTFIPSDEILYHIVVCEINEKLLNMYNITYDELIKLNPIYTFNLKDIH